MKLQERFNRMLFNMSVRGIVDTPPVARGTCDFIALSMVQKRDVYSYLLAFKSFFRYQSPARVVIVADPTLDEGDRAVMRKQIPHIEFREAREFQRAGIPKGGCWERLCAVSEYVAEGYVVQLDADTVTTGPLPEVRAAIDDGCAFTLGTEDRQTIVPSSEISNWARDRLEPDSHIQVIAESKLAEVESEHYRKYVRGCAGFAGYPRHSFDFDRMRDFSSHMEKRMPDTWNKWGTEQFTSNVLVANMAGARVLPHPKYCAPHRRKDESVFLHFIGYVRYSTMLYANLARRVASELRRAT